MHWSALALELPDAKVDEWVGRLGSGSLGVSVERTGRRWSRLVFYFDDSVSAATARELAERELARELRDRPRLERVADGRWVERYQESLRPFALGEGFQVEPAGPAGRTGTVAGRQRIVLVPGRAFGTGEHPTTRLCAEFVERSVVPGSRWLDLGCGSGILAILAARCGAASVLALDDDPEAIEVAREALRANGLEDRVEVRLGSDPPVGGGSWDGVVCNISRSFLAGHAPLLRAAMRAGGILVVSGFLGSEAEDVGRGLQRRGLAIGATAERDGWSAILLRRPD